MTTTTTMKARTSDVCSADLNDEGATTTASRTTATRARTTDSCGDNHDCDCDDDSHDHDRNPS